MADQDVASSIIDQWGSHVLRGVSTIRKRTSESCAGVEFAQLSRNDKGSFAQSQKSRTERGRLGARF